jgi:hypothetical protein
VTVSCGYVKIVVVRLRGVPVGCVCRHGGARLRYGGAGARGPSVGAAVTCRSSGSTALRAPRRWRAKAHMTARWKSACEAT